MQAAQTGPPRRCPRWRLRARASARARQARSSGAAANSILGALWLYAFTARLLTLAWAIMIALLLGLAAIEIPMRDGARSGRDYWLVRFPYSLNFGWISVATILNTTRRARLRRDVARSGGLVARADHRREAHRGRDDPPPRERSVPPRDDVGPRGDRRVSTAQRRTARSPSDRRAPD